MRTQATLTVFAGTERKASGTATQMAVAVKGLVDQDLRLPILVFDDITGEQVDTDIRNITAIGSAETPMPEVATPVPDDLPRQPQKRSPGRPKLGVVGREITLLPRHWDWLNIQPGGPSVALRKMVDQARRENESRDRRRRSREAAYRFMSAIAGDAPGFEEAIRSLFAGDHEAFAAHTRSWPPDVRDYAGRLAAEAFEDRPTAGTSEG